MPKIPEDCPASVIAAYDAIVKRAVDIPYWPAAACAPPHKFARLSIDGDTATLTWPHAELEFGDPYIEAGSTTFPASLLLLSDAELPAALTAWTDEQKAAAEREQQAAKAAAARQKEADERATLATLKAKYEGSQTSGPEAGGAVTTLAPGEGAIFENGVWKRQ